MFTLSIKSSSGLESVVHSQLLLFSGASPELPFQGCLAAHSQNTQVQSSAAAGKLGKLLSAQPQGLDFSRTNTFSTLANTGLPALLPSASSPLISPSGLIPYLPIGTGRGCCFLIPSFWIRPRILLIRYLPTERSTHRGSQQPGQGPNPKRWQVQYS